jgi:hypothetical protein
VCYISVFRRPKFICMQNKGYGSVSDHALVPNESDSRNPAVSTSLMYLLSLAGSSGDLDIFISGNDQIFRGTESKILTLLHAVLESAEACFWRKCRKH